MCNSGEAGFAIDMQPEIQLLLEERSDLYRLPNARAQGLWRNSAIGILVFIRVDATINEILLKATVRWPSALYGCSIRGGVSIRSRCRTLLSTRHAPCSSANLETLLRPARGSYIYLHNSLQVALPNILILQPLASYVLTVGHISPQNRRCLCLSRY